MEKIADWLNNPPEMWIEWGGCHAMTPSGLLLRPVVFLATSCVTMSVTQRRLESAAMSEEMLARLRDAATRVREADAAHEAVKQEAKDIQRRKRDAAKALEAERATLRQVVRDAVAEGDLKKTEIAEVAEIHRVHLYTYLQDDKKK